MKHAFIILALLATGHIQTFAQCMLKVSLTNKQVINVAVDGRYFNKKGTSVTVGDLPVGDHYLQIYTMVQKRSGRLREEVIYEGRVSTNGGMITLFEYDPERGGTINEQDLNSYAAEHSLPPGAPAITSVQNNVQNNAAMNNPDNNMDNADQPVASPVAVESIGTLTDSKIDKLKKDVSAKTTDTDKFKVLKEGLKSENISTDNVAYMMDWLNFESTKLEFAKWAYNITVDKDNFNLLDAKFSYKNYQDDFNQFISTKK